MSRRSPKRPAQRAKRDLLAFLPTTREEMEARGWDELDVLIVTGDGYVDHPAFGPVLIGRFLEGRGLRVGVVAQPRWDRTDDLLRLGLPRLFVGVSAGNMDSMLNKLTAQKKVRSEDLYSPGGRTGMRPNRATVVYSNLLRQAMPGVPIVLGGIEASLRRIAHYDYWSDTLRRSDHPRRKSRPAHLRDGRAAGVGGCPNGLQRGRTHRRYPRRAGHRVCAPQGRARKHVASEPLREGREASCVLPSYEDVSSATYARIQRDVAARSSCETNPGNARPLLLQTHGAEAVYFNPPAEPLETVPRWTRSTTCPFTRTAHCIRATRIRSPRSRP